MLESMSLQILGDAATGRQKLYQLFEQSSVESARIRSRILIGLGYVNWMNGDLHEMQQDAKQLLKLGQSARYSYSIVHACWFMGAALYQLNDLDAAADVVQIITASKWWSHQRSYSNCIQIMSFIHAARGEHLQALELSEKLIDESMESSSTYFLSEARALQAELAHLHGDDSAATRWALEFEPGPPVIGWGFTVPALMAAKILRSSGAKDAQQKAVSILGEHESFYESTNNTRFLIETLTLRATLYASLGDEDTADQLLGRAVVLAQPGGFVRVFVDLGPGIVPLLNRLELNEQQLEYVGTILAGFQLDGDKQQSNKAAGASLQEPAGLSESLSKRETEVLQLLARRLTNKEIGERLFIAPETVKRHAHNIFEKLNVSSRAAARAKAIGLGLVSD